MKKRICIASCFFVLVSFTGYGQADCACCTPVHHQFDFWLGSWLVKNTQGQEVGKNTISKIEDNCILVEKWIGAKGTTGTSHNYYDANDGSWNQLWIDNKGNILKLKGGLEGSSMVLKSEMIKGKNGKLYYNQISWTPNEDQTVSQLWEIYDENKALINTAFLGIYHKKESN